MAFPNHKNNARGSLYASISASATSLTLGSGQGDLFPATNFKVTLKQFTAGVLTKQEIILVGSRTGDVFSSISRANEPCPVSDTSNAQVQTATSFGAFVDINNGTQIFLYVTAETIDAIHTELVRLENAKLNANATILTDAVTKSGTQSISGKKIYTNVNFEHNVTANPNNPEQRRTNHAWKTKNQSNQGGVDWNIYTDADGSIIGTRRWSLWGYLKKWADGAYASYENFIDCEFDSYDGNVTFTKKITLNAVTKINELCDIIKKKTQTNASSNYLKIGSRWEISGIGHYSWGHFTQFIRGDLNNNPEGSINDGGRGLLFGPWGNPYLKMHVDTVEIGRTGGVLHVPAAVITHDSGYIRRVANDLEANAGTSTTTVPSVAQAKLKSKVIAFTKSGTTQRITHNLGKNPSCIQFSAKGIGGTAVQKLPSGAFGGFGINSDGAWDGSSQIVAYTEDNGSAMVVGSNSSCVIYINGTTGTLNRMDPNFFDVAWSGGASVTCIATVFG